MKKVRKIYFRGLYESRRLIQRYFAGWHGFIDENSFRKLKRKYLPQQLFVSFQELAPWGTWEQGRSVLVSRLDDDTRRVLSQVAKDALEHRFDLLGSESVDLGHSIDWHTDFKSGYRWNPKLRFTKISWAGLPSGTEIKVPWDLSRCLHFIPLGLGNWLKADPRYYESYKSDIRSWIQQNPASHGVNWFCPMDVALRGINWLIGALLFAPSIRTDTSRFHDELTNSLWKHMLYLNRNLEEVVPSTGGNHLLADLSGLVILGLFFKPLPKASGIFNRAWNKLNTEIVRQVHADGSFHENSISYQRLVLEMFMLCGAMAGKAGYRYNSSAQVRIDNMMRFIWAAEKSDGSVDWIGDEDDGRVLDDHLLRTNDFSYLGPTEVDGRYFPIRHLLDGSTGVAVSHESGVIPFPDGGFVFAKNGGVHFSTRCGSLGRNGGHDHNDQLSFCLHIDGTDAFVDRGTGVYTPDPACRNRFRSTKAHSTLSVNDQEQNPIE